MQQNSYAAREQARWMQPNASLWMRPDAARFLKPGTRAQDVYPALARKYNPNQPRVPAGNPDGGSGRMRRVVRVHASSSIRRIGPDGLRVWRR